MDPKSLFYRCEICGNLVYLIDEGKGTLVCCGQDMVNLVANTGDGAVEKHVPVFVEGDPDSVKVGELPHPMEEAHHIEWVFVECCASKCLYKLDVGKAPEIPVMCQKPKPSKVYAYCNLHGLYEATF
ncbi:MAG: desulfoferrodoxin FeS4 iron-binding domain-containing protein [Coriobacteriia bacterium]|nr:desulfoferrodoxin FeS4 iron-binding domain-containing protein [Coriobacteriia bacterium]